MNDFVGQKNIMHFPWISSHNLHEQVDDLAFLLKESKELNNGAFMTPPSAEPNNTDPYSFYYENFASMT